MVLKTALREILISLLGKDVVSLVRNITLPYDDTHLLSFCAQAEPILAALKPRLLDGIHDPRLALRAYFVVLQVPIRTLFGSY